MKTGKYAGGGKWQKLRFDVSAWRFMRSVNVYQIMIGIAFVSYCKDAVF